MMLSEPIIGPIRSEKFRTRGKKIGRIETLSDAVFAFSVSLLVASLEVPQTFSELYPVMKGALPFFATVAFLFMLWYKQYSFFRKYGINDFKTILLNLIYLAVVLFYLYPMKFLFSLLLSWFTGISFFPRALDKLVITDQQFPRLVILYSVGYFAIWILLYLMYSRALRLARELQLDKYEVLYTKKERRGTLLNAMIGIIGGLIAWMDIPWLSGLCYLVMIPSVGVFNEVLFKRQVRKQVVTQGTDFQK